MEEKDLRKVVLGVVVVGLVLVIGIYIIAQMGTAVDNSTLASFSVGNESGGFINSTGYILAGYGGTNWVLVSAVVLNATDNTTVAAGNYTISATGVLTNATVTTYSTVLVSYTYTTGYANTEAAVNASSDMVDALSNGTPWLTILVVVAFAVLVLGMLIGGLGKATSGKGAPTY